VLPLSPYILLLGAFIAWAGLMFSWSRYIGEISERRRKEAVSQGETPPDMKGVSNYERAELREDAHRDMKVMPRERWIGRGLFFGVPALILTVFLATTPL